MGERMTTTVNGRSQTSACNGVTTSFVVGFSFEPGATLLVFLLDAADAANDAGTLLTEGVDYTVTGDGSVAGSASVHTTTAYPTGKYLRRWRDTNLDQQADYVANDGFPAASHEKQLDRLSRVTEELSDGLGRTLRISDGLAGVDPIVPEPGGVVGFDDDGNPVVLDPEELIELLEDVTFPDTFRLSYGARVPIRTLRLAREALADLSSEVVGYAANPNSGGAGVTGGEGYDEYYVDDPSFDSSRENTFGWAIASAKDAGGGLIYFDPRGKFDVIVTDEATLRFNDGEDNITVYAPGMNVTIWHTSLSGGTVIKGANHIWKNIVFRTLSGPMSGDFDGTGAKIEQILVNVAPQFADRIAFLNCEFRHASDGALDMAATAFTGASAECNVTVQDCIFWDTDEVSLIGSTSDTSTASDARKMFVTFSGCIWAYCGQRQPKALGLAMVHLVNCYALTQPWQRDQPSPVAEFGACHGASVQDGGWLRAEGCLWSASDGVGGYEATKLVENPTSHETGRITVVDCAAEDAMTFAAATTAVAAPAYSLAHSAVPAVGAAREAWIAARWLAAGARADAAPDGLFAWTDTTDAYPNGETVLVERGRTGRWLRVDGRADYAALSSSTPQSSQSLIFTTRSYSRYVGYLEGKLSGSAIGPTALDLTGIDSSFFQVVADDAAADLKFLMYADGATTPPDGLHLFIRGTTASVVTLKSAVSIVATVASTVANTLGVTAHGMTTGDFPVSLTTDGVMPGGVVSAQQYWAIVVDANTIKLAASYDDAIAGTAVDITSAGSGTHVALIGNLNLPASVDVVLDRSAKVIHLLYDSGTQRFGLVTDTDALGLASVDWGLIGGTLTDQADLVAYIATAVTGLLDLKGSTDCSANPNYPAASKGDAYIVTVAGKIGGASGTSVDAGDWYIALADNAGGTQAGVGTSWAVVEHNLVAATAAEIQAGTAGRVVAPDKLIASAVFQTLTDAATIAWDMAAGYNAKVTLGGNRTQGTPTNPKEGITYTLLLIQDGTGSRTWTPAASMKFGSAGNPTLSTAAGKKDMVFLQCIDAATPEFRCTFNKDA